MKHKFGADFLDQLTCIQMNSFIDIEKEPHHPVEEAEEEEKRCNEQQPKYLTPFRDILNYQTVIELTGYCVRRRCILSDLKKTKAKEICAGAAGLLPILGWLPKYSLKCDLLCDMIAGASVAIMHIPHGIAYGILAGLGPINGLSTSIFPVMVYFFFGTSRHISIGTLSVMGLMTLRVIQAHAEEEEGYSDDPNAKIYTNQEVGAVLTFTVGVMHLLMSILHLGMIANILSEPIVNGFSTGAAFHVLSRLLKDVLGVPETIHKGPFKIFKIVYEMAGKIPDANIVTVAFFLAVIIFIATMHHLVKPWVKECYKMPVPIELIAICGSTLISRYWNVNELYGVALVDPIPQGLPLPSMPPVELMPEIAIDAIAIAVVSYSILMSMGITFAKRHSYEIRPNQELFAMGVGNVVGGCFHCLPMACSLTRSLIQEQTEGKSQFASLLSAILILMTLLWFGPFFSTTPRCALAAVIVFALKSLVKQVADIKIFARHGWLEWLTWVVTFLGVVIIDIEFGLLVGVCFALLTVYIKGLKHYGAVLGELPQYDSIYVDLRNHPNAVEVPQTKIFRYCGSLNFATRMKFRKLLYHAIELDCYKQCRASFRILVLDFSCLSRLDGAGCDFVDELIDEMNQVGVRLLIASPTDPVYETLLWNMEMCGSQYEVFPTLHDAVLFARTVDSFA